jgi:CelD/BcsL family acetyltransferase involved in cellulose biosynthesis
VEASGWKGKGGTATAVDLDRGLRAFYAALTRRFAAQGRCRIHAIRHHGRPIAVAFSLQLDHTLYMLKIAYDESYARFSPGNLLYWYIIREACEDPQLETYNMVSDAAWWLPWRPHVATVHDIVLFRPGFAGRIADAEQHALAKADDWRHRAARRWFVTTRGRRRLDWQRLRGR